MVVATVPSRKETKEENDNEKRTKNESAFGPVAMRPSELLRDPGGTLRVAGQAPPPHTHTPDPPPAVEAGLGLFSPLSS